MSEEHAKDDAQDDADASPAAGDGQGGDASQPAGEAAGSGDDPPTPVGSELPPAKHDRTLLGIKLHNWIFVGMGLGLLLGLLTFSIDHFDHLQLADGTALKGTIHTHADEYVVMQPDGTETRVLARDVAEDGLVKAKDTDGGQLYGNLIWWFNFFGSTLFMGALKMIIAPLILASIVAGIVSLPGLDQLKRIGFKTMGYYILSTTVAVTIGLVAVLVIAPGKKESSQSIRTQRETVLKSREVQYTEETHLSARTDAGKSTKGYLSWLAAKEAESAGTGHEAERFSKLAGARGTSAGDILKNNLVVPMLTNPFASLTERKSLGIITFALLLGVAIVVVGPSAKPVADVFVGFNDVIITITEWLMAFAPFCVMCIVAELVGTKGPQVFATLAWYVVTVIVGIGLHVAFLFAVAKVFGGKSPKELWNGIREAWMIAFTTRSSAATLPVTMRCVTTNLGVSPRVANFGLPVGATMNMDGTALYEGVAVIFLLQIYAGVADVPIEMSAAITFLIFVTAVMASVGAAAVPDAGLVTMVLVAEAVGLPVYYIPLIFAVDAFLDMFRTSTNVLGDTVGTLVVQQWEGIPSDAT